MKIATISTIIAAALKTSPRPKSEKWAPILPQEQGFGGCSVLYIDLSIYRIGVNFFYPFGS